MEEPANASNKEADFSVPKRAVLTMGDMHKWENSQAYYDYLGFVLTMNDAVRGRSCCEIYHISEITNALLELLQTLSSWVEEIPPIQQPQRFGNKAFKTWYEKLKQEAHSLLLNKIPVTFHRGLAEAQFYLIESFGNSTRIDYGTGHEMAFVMFLCCLFKIGALVEEDKLAAVLYVFNKYLILCRKLQTVYVMEPAGSRGVWALDDFQFIPFIWGSSQLIGHPNIDPSKFTKNEIVLSYHEHYMFIACIKYIMENKKGLFAEHSNQLWNISAVMAWEKVNAGLIKMYKGEVLSKFPVIQHVLFGSILPFTPIDPSSAAPIYEKMVREGLCPRPPDQSRKACVPPPMVYDKDRSASPRYSSPGSIDRTMSVASTVSSNRGRQSGPATSVPVLPAHDDTPPARSTPAAPHVSFAKPTPVMREQKDDSPRDEVKRDDSDDSRKSPLEDATAP